MGRGTEPRFDNLGHAMPMSTRVEGATSGETDLQEGVCTARVHFDLGSDHGKARELHRSADSVPPADIKGMHCKEGPGLPWTTDAYYGQKNASVVPLSPNIGVERTKRIRSST